MKSEEVLSVNKKIFMTGATSGIGFQALLRLLKAGNILTILCRDRKTEERILNKVFKEIKTSQSLKNKIYTCVADLGDLKSIEECANKLLSNNIDFDIFIFNAGLQYTGSPNPLFSSQGFELTFAVNHLSHQYLLHKLLPLLDKSVAPRIVVTSSEVHNPNTPGGRIGLPAGLGQLEGLSGRCNTVMLDGISKFSADKAYKDSKLCNILFCRELVRRLKLRNTPMPVIAWAPGLVIPRTNKGFFRYSRQNNEFSQRLFALIARDLLHVTETPNNAGKLLSMVATKELYQNNGFKYYSNRLAGFGTTKTFSETCISDEALNNELSSRLWELSSELANINPELTPLVDGINI